MRFFISQRVTGENIEDLKNECKLISSALTKKGHSCYNTLDEVNFEDKSKKEMMLHAFDKINDSDCLLVIIRSQNKSEGLLMEVGYALSKSKRIILCIKEGIKDTYLPEIADSVIKFNNFDEIYTKLEGII